ncbi:MAG: hypothetical protein ACLVK4_01765 [Alistipes shahii]|uniref:hypothetical protein n=1 Tax=Alistipes shahii TaxID=328814 RepID=UPI00399D3403
MKRLLLLVAAAAFAACGNNPRKTVADRQQDDCVEVLCFYGQNAARPVLRLKPA